MSDDLTSLLRGESGAHFAGNLRDRRTIGALLFKAADLLEALRAENARLREALGFYASLPQEWTVSAGRDVTYGSLNLLGERARAALKGGDHG